MLGVGALLSLAVFFNYAGFISIPSVNAIYISRETFKAGVVKTKTLEEEAFLKVLETYDLFLPLLVDLAKEKAGDDEFSKKVDEKVKEFKDKALGEAGDLYAKFVVVSKEFNAELIKEESDTSAAGFFGYNKENEAKKKELLDRYNKAIKDFDEKYAEGKKKYTELFKLCYEKLGSNNKTVRDFLRNLHLAKFQELAAKVLVLSAFVRRDEVGDASTEGWKYYVAPFSTIADAESAFVGFEGKFKGPLLAFFKTVNTPFATVVEKVIILEAKAKDGINQSKEKLEDAKKALDEVKKLKGEIDAEVKKIVDAFKKHNGDFEAKYKERDSKIDFSVEKKELEAIVKKVTNDLPNTFDGFFVQSLVVAVLAIAISSLSNINKKTEL